MQRITIGRYKPSQHPLNIVDADTGESITSTDVSDFYDGWIEGTRDDGSTWIMWLDANGNPSIFWAQRDELGGVEGDPVVLTG